MLIPRWAWIAVLGFLSAPWVLFGAAAGSIGDCLPTDCCAEADCAPAGAGELVYNAELDAWDDKVTGDRIYSSWVKNNGQRYVRELPCLPQTFVCRAKTNTATYCILKSTKM